MVPVFIRSTGILIITALYSIYIYGTVQYSIIQQYGIVEQYSTTVPSTHYTLPCRVHVLCAVPVLYLSVLYLHSAYSAFRLPCTSAVEHCSSSYCAVQ
jgi:hypothetical protein